MDLQTKLNIADATRRFIDKTDITQDDLARQAGISSEYLSHIVNDKFSVKAGKGKSVDIAPKYFNRLAGFIGYNTQKSYWQHKPTPQLTAILAYLEDARNFGTTNVIIGETGSGKTLACELFLRTYPADTFKITVGSSDNLGDLIDKILDALKLTAGKTKSKKLRDIARKLKSMRENGQKPTLILDEAEYMKQPALASIKELHDYLYQYAAIVLIGTDQLTSNIDRLRRRNRPGIPQFYRRIKFGIRRLSPVDRTYKLFLDEMNIDNATKRFIRSIADNYGELHDVLVPVRREADRTGDTINERFIRKVLNLQNSLF